MLKVDWENLTVSAGNLQDQTSSRTNTLFDDADDIQRQLDNEARDRIKFGRPKTIWVFHLPTNFAAHNSIMGITEQIRYPRHLKHRKKTQCNDVNDDDDDDDSVTPAYAPPADWNYASQGSWPKLFPKCGAKSQSPVDLPVNGLIKPRGARMLMFQNHHVLSKTMTLTNNGKQMILFGEWKNEQRPLIYGGAAHSRRYLFDSLVIHLPAEHTVGSLFYPMETQLYYVSAEYKDMNEALASSASDPQAILAVANLYSYSDHTHQGVLDIFDAAKKQGFGNATIDENSLSYFSPPFKEYACYQGSMTTPPCIEAVLWLIRGKTLHITRETWETARRLMTESTEDKQINFRLTQPLNDRKVYFFQ